MPARKILQELLSLVKTLLAWPQPWNIPCAYNTSGQYKSGYAGFLATSSLLVCVSVALWGQSCPLRTNAHIFHFSMAFPAVMLFLANVLTWQWRVPHCPPDNPCFTPSCCILLTFELSSHLHLSRGIFSENWPLLKSSVQLQRSLPSAVTQMSRPNDSVVWRA